MLSVTTNPLPSATKSRCSQIDAIASSGSTYMEDGLRLGFELARPCLPSSAKQPGEALASVEISYSSREGARESAALELDLTQAPSLGLQRGILLVNEATALRAAAHAHHVENDQEAAYQLVRALSQLMSADNDSSLAPEREMVAKLEETLSRLPGHQREALRGTELVTGLPGH